MYAKFTKAVLAAAVAAAALAPLVGSAAPDPVLFGGGATFPATAWGGPSWLIGPPGGTAPSPSLRLTAPGDYDPAVGGIRSYFGAYTSSTLATPIAFLFGSTTRPEISYCQSGSGTGKIMLTGGPVGNFTADPDCPTFAVASFTAGTHGFSGDQVDVDYAGTDSPLNSTEYGHYIANKGAARVQPVQVPAVAGAIGVIYNNVQTGTTIGANIVNLTESQVCQIWSGQINNWSQLGFPAKPITVVYRSDSSGTSFAFSNHLSYVCPIAEPIAVPAVGSPAGTPRFSTNQVFSGAFPGGAPIAGALGASGNGGIVNTVFNTDGAIGFADVSDTVYRAQLNPLLNQIQYFSISLKDGLNGLGRKYARKSPQKIAKKFKLATGAIQFDRAVGPNDANGRPTLVSLVPAPVRSGCVMTVNPDSYATAVIDPISGDYKGYPIMAVSYLLAHSGGNGENTLNLQQLFAASFGPITPDFTTTEGVFIEGTISGRQNTITQTKGYAFLSGFANPTKTVIKNCILP